MPRTAKLLATVSRPEFIPANSASLIIGASWGISLPVDIIWGLAVPIALIYATITLVAAFAAQINTVSDYESDLKDSRKERLVQAMDDLGAGRLKPFMVIELLLSLACLVGLFLTTGKPALMPLWAAAVFFAYAYSAPPLRLKAHSWSAVITLILVLSVLPVTFVFHTFSSQLDHLFLLFLAGQALTVYGVIVPAEIRDFFTDKELGITTMTVRLGLVNASIAGMALLSVGGILCGAGLFLRLMTSHHPVLALSLVVMLAAYFTILRKYWRLNCLSKRPTGSEPNESAYAQEIVDLAANNPQWITLITQTIVLMSLVLLLSKVLA